MNDDEQLDGQTYLVGGDEGDLPVDSEQRVIVAKNDRSLFELARWHANGRLVIDPEWQREYVWDAKRASRLIESILMEIPVPVIYLAETGEKKYEVIDGLQRLTSVFDFFENKFALSSLEVLRDQNGKVFKDLDSALQNKLHDATFRTFELASSTRQDLKFVIFERLNTGGLALNDMEIRNCLYRGELNKLLRDLAKNDDFNACINSRAAKRRMQDRALVLRFLAFHYLALPNAKDGLKKFLNTFMDDYRNPKPDQLKKFEEAFKKAMRLARTIFGDQAFRVLKDRSAGGGEWAPRPNAAIFQAVSVPLANCDTGQVTRANDRIFEAYLDLVYSDQKWIDAVTKSTADYNNLEYAFKTWDLRLHEALANEEPNDNRRLFSRQLKKQMFQANNICSSCNAEIKTLEDAALDHDKHYWRGGLTVPDNAQLMHRHCNLVKPN